jgi:hypothetical protein
MTRALVLALAAGVLLAVGCGDDRPTGPEIFDEFSTQDSETLMRVLEPMGTAADVQNQLRAHLDPNDPATARSVDRLERLLYEAEAETRELNGMDVRSTMSGWVRTVRRSVDALDTALMASADPNIPDREFTGVLRDLRGALDAAREADREIIRYLAEAMPEGRGDDFRAEMRRQLRELEEQVSP